MGTPKQQRVLGALLQEEDDGVPENDVEFHGGKLVETMEELKKAYEDKLSEVEEIEEKAVDSHKDYIDSKISQKETAEQDLDTKTEDLNGVKEEIGTAESALGTAKAMLFDDENYLRDLTSQCELKAAAWGVRGVSI